MVKLVIRVLALVILGLAISTSALADGITLSSNFPSGYIYYSFTDTLGQNENLPVAPYSSTTTINGITSNSLLACMDLYNATDVGQFYQGTFGTAKNTDENEVSWLADRLAGTSKSSPSPNSGPISMAIWEIEASDGESGVIPIDPAAAIWITAASNAVANGYKADNLFFTPSNGSSQRFVEIPLTSPVPEPGTLGMMAIGLVGVVGMMRRKFGR
jgi:hypothetical protein